MKKIISLLVIITLIIGGFIKFEKESSSDKLTTGLKEQKTIEKFDMNKAETGKNNKVKSEEVDDSEPSRSSYSNESISFDYPGEWTTLENPTEDILYVDFCDPNIGIEPVFKFFTGEAGLVNLERTMEDYEMILSRTYSNVTIKELSKETINDNDAIKLIFTCTMQEKEYTIIQHEMINGYASFKFKYKVLTEMAEGIENKVDLIIKSIKFI